MEITTVSTTTNVQATTYTPQRQSFIAQGRFWVFYHDGTDESNWKLYYRSRVISPLGSWSSATVVDSTSHRGYHTSLWFDGTYVHWSHGSYYMSDPLYYRRGTPNSNGTISWGTMRTAVGGVRDSMHEFNGITVDSGGYPVIGWAQSFGGTGGAYDTLKIKIATSTDGSSWGAEKLLDSNSDVTICGLPILLPLASRKFLVIWTNQGIPALRSALWNGSSFEAIRNIASVNTRYYSAVVLGTKVLLVYAVGSKVYSRVWTEDSWGPTRKVADGNSVTLTKLDNDRAIAFVCKTSTQTSFKVIGSPDDGDNMNAEEDRVIWYPFTAQKSETVTHIAIKTSSAVTGNAKVAIYDDDGDAPGNLLGKNDSGSPCSGGWNFISLDSSVELTEGTTYWLAAITDVKGVQRADSNDHSKKLAYKSTAYSTYTFPAVADYTAPTVTGYLRYFQGWGSESTGDEELLAVEYGKGWQDSYKVGEPDPNMKPASWISDYEAVSGLMNIVWTQGASSPYNVRHMSDTFDFPVWASTGYIWVEGTNFAYVDNDEVKRLKEGSLTGDPDGDPGYPWIYGNYTYYVDADGKVRRIEGTLTGLEGKQPSQISINTKYPTKFCYIDADGKERCFEGTT